MIRIEEIRVEEINEEIKALKTVKDLVKNKKEILFLINEREKEKEELIKVLTKDDEVTKRVLRLFVKICYLNKPLKKDEQYKLIQIIRDNFGRNKVDLDSERCGLRTWLRFLDFETLYYKESKDDSWATLIIEDEFEDFDDEEWE